MTLATIAGLIGSGDGTGSLSYSGPLAALNAALDGLTFTPPPDFDGTTTLSLDAESLERVPSRSQVSITDGVFVVTTTADSGPGSLRQAILDSNAATGGTNTIDFAIPGDRHPDDRTAHAPARDHQPGPDRRHELSRGSPARR